MKEKIVRTRISNELSEKIDTLKKRNPDVSVPQLIREFLLEMVEKEENLWQRKMMKNGN